MLTIYTIGGQIAGEYTGQILGIHIWVWAVICFVIAFGITRLEHIVKLGKLPQVGVKARSDPSGYYLDVENMGVSGLFRSQIRILSSEEYISPNNKQNLGYRPLAHEARTPATLT